MSFLKLRKLVSLPASTWSKSIQIRRHSRHGGLQPAWTAASRLSQRHPRACNGNERNAGAQVSPGARIYPIPPLNSMWTLWHPWPEKGLVTPGSDPSGMPTSDPTKQTPRKRASQEEEEPDGKRRAMRRTHDGLSSSAAFSALLNKPP